MWQRVRSCREAASAALRGEGGTVSEFDYGMLLSKEVSAILNELENIVTSKSLCTECVHAPHYWCFSLQHFLVSTERSEGWDTGGHNGRGELEIELVGQSNKSMEMKIEGRGVRDAKGQSCQV